MQIFSPELNILLAELEKTDQEFWNIPREVGCLLYFLARAKRVKKALEIGTSNGYSGLWLAEAIKNSNSDEQGEAFLITVESHLGRYNLAKNNFAKAGLESFVKQTLGHAPEVFSTVPEIMAGEFDLVFMDGTKSQHSDYLKAILNLVKVGGLIIADNVLSHWDKMQVFVEMVNQMPELEGEVVKIGDGVMLIYKK